MYGAILGDIAGSRFEFSKPSNFNWKNEPFFDSTSRFTDDTVLTVATKYAILNGMDYARAYGMFGRRYRNAGYGDMFIKWIDNGSRVGYGSFGNGSAMRVSFIGEHFRTLEEVHKQAELSSICTHSHPKGILAAKASAGIIFLAKNGYSKKEIVKYINKNYNYNFHKPLIAFKINEKFDATAEGSMPLAIRCFLKGESWEDTIRNVYRIKCDTDTICCIAGSFAEAYYGKTGMDDIKLLDRYLIRPDKNGKFDKMLFEWATKK